MLFQRSTKPSQFLLRCSLLLFTAVGLGIHLNAQYFQQQVDYRITAELDDQKHVLHAHLKLDYTNNAPEPLTEIYFHLWPRAFGSDNTAFARQQLRDGDTRFHFSEEAERGTLDSLDFQVNNSPLNWRYPDPDNPDIALVTLNEPLASGETVTISTPFRVKIPASFSRLGHVGESYQMTQWYPKPAVYDQDGWHAMPYLDRGEFYSEFGSFEVAITLPENYQVAATGVLQNAEERARLLQLAAATERTLAERQDLPDHYVSEPFPGSQSSTKTLVYTAQNVHDFAWFADKRFKVLHRSVVLEGRDEPLDIWSFFTETEAAYWKQSLDYLERSTKFYSEKIGVYPYPQVTGVQSALSAGAGMEYPMITVIGRSYSASSLDEVLAHEVGHNWFYGVLASNERTHPWMDEGFNSFYERLYMERYYEEPKNNYRLFGESIDINALGYRYQTLRGAGQSPDMDSDSMAENNYWLNAYSKPDMALQYLSQRYGQHVVDLAMQAYYQKWQFKHPGPEDVKLVFEQTVGAKLNWLFDDFLRSNKTVDFSLSRKSDGQVMVKRRGEINVPVLLTSKEGPDKLRTTLLDSIAPGGRLLPAGDYTLLAGPLDLNTGNNFLQRPLRLQLLTRTAATDGSRQLFYIPLLGANAQDGLMAGAALHNRTLEPKMVEFILAPAYGTKSGALSGFGGIRWRLPEQLRPAFAQTGEVAIGYQRFSNFEFRNEAYQYERLAGSWSYDFAIPPIRQIHARLSAQIVNVRENRPAFTAMGELDGSLVRSSLFTRLEYQRQKDNVINPRQLRLRLEYGNPDAPLTSDFLKAELEWSGGYQYQKDRFVRWRLFGGYFLQNELRDRNIAPNYAFSLVGNAASDYAFDELYLGRADDRSYGQQLNTRMGGFRTPIDRAQGIGVSNDYLIALNLDARLPIGPDALPLGVFADAATYGRSPLRQDGEAAVQWAAGLSLTALDGKIGIYAPLFYSDTIDLSLQQRGGLLQRISFRLSLTDFLPWNIIDSISL